MDTKTSKKGQTNRNLLAYLLESKIWKKFEAEVVENIDYWKKEDFARACNMHAARQVGLKGYRVCDWIWDVHGFVCDSKLKLSTKKRLYKEIEELEEYHMIQGTYKEEA